jgi:hypothetical protein
MFKQGFKDLAPVCAEACMQHVIDANIPAFGMGQIELAFEDAGIASCLTATRNDFANLPHKDNDSSPYTYGVWLTTKTNGDLVMDEDECRNAVQGGEFFWADYGIAADFGACPGLIELIWRGKDDRHGTARSVTRDGYQRWGTSVQVSGRLSRFLKKNDDLDALKVEDLQANWEKWKTWRFEHRKDKTTYAQQQAERKKLKEYEHEKMKGKPRRVRGNKPSTSAQIDGGDADDSSDENQQ